MITLTRLDGETFALNEDLIERVEPHADTTIFTVGGNVYTVSESPTDVVGAVREEKAAILRASLQAATSRHLTVVPGQAEGDPL